MKKFLLLLIIPFLSFGQKELELRPNEKIIMEDIYRKLEVEVERFKRAAMLSPVRNK